MAVKGEPFLHETAKMLYEQSVIVWAGGALQIEEGGIEKTPHCLGADRCLVHVLAIFAIIKPRVSRACSPR